MNNNQQNKLNGAALKERFPMLSGLIESLVEANVILTRWSEVGVEIFNPESGQSRRLSSDTRQVNEELGKVIASQSNLIRTRPECLVFIPLRGISFRHMELPGDTGGDIRQMVALQLEQDLPLPLSEFSWGCFQGDKTAEGNTPVVAGLVRKGAPGIKLPELNVHKARIILVPGIIEAGRIFARTSDHKSFDLIHIEEKSTEWTSWSEGCPKESRTLGISQSVWERPGGSEMEELIRQCGSGNLYVLGTGAAPMGSWRAFHEWVSSIQPELKVHPLVTSDNGMQPLLEFIGEHKSAVHPADVLWLENDPLAEATKNRQYRKEELTKWSAITVCLLLCVAGLRYIEPLLHFKSTESQLKAVQAQLKIIPEIDREVGFLQMMDNNFLPFESVIPAICSSVNAQFQLTELTMNRRGEVNISADVKNADQIGEYRRKLMGSGFFKSVTVESQTPDPKKKNIAVRIRAILTSTDKLKQSFQSIIKENTGNEEDKKKT